MGFNTTEKKSEKAFKDFSEYFKPSTTIKVDKGLKIALYGEAKSGKTYFGLTAPKPIAIIDTENGVQQNKYSFSKEEQDMFLLLRVIEDAVLDVDTNKIDVVEGLIVIEEALGSIVEMLHENPDALKTVMIDSGTDLWDWLGIWLDERAETKKTKSGAMPQFEWGKANKKYTEMMYKLLKSNANVIATFRAVDAYSETGERLGYKVPKWQKNTDYWFDFIAELKDKGIHRELIIHGNRFGIPKGTIIKNAQWNDVVDLIKKYSKTEIFNGGN